MKLKEALLNGATALAALAAVAVSISYFRGGDAQGIASPPRKELVRVDDWQTLLRGGHRIGPVNATLTIAEFGDFQCPACAGYAAVLDSVRKRHPAEFAIVFHHYPLPYHQLAYPLARASECAAAQGRFTEFHDSTFARRSTLGVIPISEMGPLIGVSDTIAFRRCVRDSGTVQAIDDDIALGKRIKVDGTPAIIVDGLMHYADFRVQDFENLIRQKTLRPTP